MAAKASTTEEQLFAKALALSRQARIQLIEMLHASLEPKKEKLSRAEWKAAWATELDKRVEGMKSGKVKGIPAAKVMAELKAKYG